MRMPSQINMAVNSFFAHDQKFTAPPPPSLLHSPLRAVLVSAASLAADRITPFRQYKTTRRRSTTDLKTSQPTATQGRIFSGTVRWSFDPLKFNMPWKPVPTVFRSHTHTHTHNKQKTPFHHYYLRHVAVHGLLRLKCQPLPPSRVLLARGCMYVCMQACCPPCCRVGLAPLQHLSAFHGLYGLTRYDEVSPFSYA